MAMWFEEIRSAAIKGQCCDRRDHMGVAHKATKGGFHPVDGDQDPDRYTILPLQRGIKVWMAGFAFSPLRRDDLESTDLHEFVEAVTTFGCDPPRWSRLNIAHWQAP